ncbi:hypothetical protein HY990_00810 [Candidatus Micrarchaeota archaeon]|nr:hypothetical protein [Candidatus Micrarchaeota archaeon]
MNFNSTELSRSMWIIVASLLLLVAISIFAPSNYVYCGSCTQNAKNCECTLFHVYFIFVYLSFPFLFGLIYYYLKAKPSLVSMLIVCIILFLFSILALFLTFFFLNLVQSALGSGLWFYKKDVLII